MLLANAQPTSEIIWPWFIVGCILLAVAIVAFFWGFALGKLTSGQHFLLMWILPLSSGFAAGCFAGSLTATGPIGQIAITATGGFAVWLLSYFLLPKPSTAPPDSISTKLLPGMSFRDAATFLANLDGYSASCEGFDDPVLEGEISSGQLTAAGVPELLQQLKHRFVSSSIKIDYEVVTDKAKGLYTISKI